MAKSNFNFAAADAAAHGKPGMLENAVAEITGATDYYNRSQDRQFDGCNCYLVDPPDEWARVLQMRKDGHPLIKGGNYKDPRECLSGQTTGREHAKGLTNRRAVVSR